MCRLTHEEIAVAADLLWLKDFVNPPEITQRRDLRHECAATCWRAV